MDSGSGCEGPEPKGRSGAGARRGAGGGGGQTPAAGGAGARAAAAAVLGPLHVRVLPGCWRFPCYAFPCVRSAAFSATPPVFSSFPARCSSSDAAPSGRPCSGADGPLAALLLPPERRGQSGVPKQCWQTGGKGRTKILSCGCATVSGARRRHVSQRPGGRARACKPAKTSSRCPPGRCAAGKLWPCVPSC